MYGPNGSSDWSEGTTGRADGASCSATCGSGTRKDQHSAVGLQHGLALFRIDRVADALDAGLSLTAGGLAIRLTDPNDVRTPPKQTVA